MKTFDRNKFNRFIEEKNVFGFYNEAKILDDGRKTWFFIDWKPLMSDVFLTDKLADFVLAFAKSNKLKVDSFYGVPESATKIALICQYKLAKQSEHFGEKSHVLSLGRGNPRAHHKKPEDNYFLGKPSGEVIVIEDVVASGDSLIDTLDHLKEANIHVSAVIALSDRLDKRSDNLSVKEIVEKRGLKFYCMSSLIEILPILYKRLVPRKEIANELTKEFHEAHISEIRLL